MIIHPNRYGVQRESVVTSAIWREDHHPEKRNDEGAYAPMQWRREIWASGSKNLAELAEQFWSSAFLFDASTISRTNRIMLDVKEVVHQRSASCYVMKRYKFSHL